MKTRLLIILGMSILAGIILLSSFSIEKDNESYVLFCNHWAFSSYKTCTVLWHEIDPLSDEYLEPSTFCSDVKKLSNYPWHCPGITTPTELTQLKSTGFDVCNIDGDEYYVLSTGQTGTITYEIYRGFDLNDPPAADAQIEIIKNTPSFISQPSEGTRKSFLPDGISVTYDPSSVMLGFNQSAIITATVSVDDNAQKDTFWLGLSPYTCFGGWHQKFAVVDK
jgi:hypothetical protein